MSVSLKLKVAEYNRMVEQGAFDHLNRKIELIRGEICQMNPAGPLHNDLVMYLTDWSVRASDPDHVRVTVQTGLELSDLQSCPEPDLQWLRAGRYRERHPRAGDVLLAIEVSDSSLQADLIEKAALYAEAGIVEYWIVDAKGRCIHVFRSPQSRQYAQRTVAKPAEMLAPLQHCRTPLNLADLFE